MTNESTAALIAIANEYRQTGRPLPPHVIADLMDAANCDSIALTLRNQAWRLMRQVEAA